MNYPALFDCYYFCGHEFRVFFGRDYLYPFEEASSALRHIFSNFFVHSNEFHLSEEKSLPYPFYGRDFRDAGPIVTQWSYPDQVFYWRWGQPSLFHIEALSNKVSLPTFLHRVVANIQTLCLEASPFVWISGLTLFTPAKMKIFIGPITPLARSWARNFLKSEKVKLWSYGVNLIDLNALKITSHISPIQVKDCDQLGLPYSSELGDFVIFEKHNQQEMIHKEFECFSEENGKIISLSNNKLIMISLLKNSNLYRFSEEIPKILQLLGQA